MGVHNVLKEIDKATLRSSSTLDAKAGTVNLAASAATLGFHEVTPVVQAAAPTAAVATITHTAPGTDDFLWADVTTTTPYGLANQDEARSVLKAIRINQLRIGQIETALKNIGLLAS